MSRESLSEDGREIQLELPRGAATDSPPSLRIRTQTLRPPPHHYARSPSSKHISISQGLSFIEYHLRYDFATTSRRRTSRRKLDSPRVPPLSESHTACESDLGRVTCLPASICDNDCVPIERKTKGVSHANFHQLSQRLR